MNQATLITIGDELLYGQVIDTNSAWIAKELNLLGILVRRRIAVGDQADEIRNALNEASATTSLIILTGGLGPTSDDITKPLLQEYFGGRMITDEATLAHITHLFREVYKRPLTERNIKQAEVPESCTALMNTRGTAPGMWFEKNGRLFVSLPGVPMEMQGLMQEQVIPRLKERLSLPPVLHRTLVTFGIGESMLADRLMSFEAQLPPDIKLAYLPHHGMIRLRLSLKPADGGSTEATLDHWFEKLCVLTQEHRVAERDESPEQILGRLLRERQQTISTAESCTGGYISHLITSVPGSSEYFQGGLVTYSYESKNQWLKVNTQTLIEKGAVSEEVVRQMAEGLLQQTNSDYVLAVSGIMGPGGGTPEKPMGTVWIALGSRSQIRCQCYHFRGDRSRNIQFTALNALFGLIRLIREESSD